MVSDLVYDKVDANLIFVDQSEGIYWTDIPSSS